MMDRIEYQNELISNLKMEIGDSFQCDAEAIANHYKVANENQSNLSIKILSVAGGIIASGAFLGFLGIAGVFNSTFAVLVLGALFICTSIWLNVTYEKLIIDTFSISAYVVGLVMVGFALLSFELNPNLVNFIIPLISLIALILCQNYILSFLSTIIIWGSILTFIVSNDLYDLVHLYNGLLIFSTAYLFLKESKFYVGNKKISKLYNPVKIASIFSLLSGLFILALKSFIGINPDLIWISSIPIIIVLIYLVKIILEMFSIDNVKNKILSYSVVFLLFIPTVFAPAILGAVFIILISFLVNSKNSFALGIIALTYFIFQYYYDLNFTLLTKSIILIGSGLLFMVLYFLINSKVINDKKI